MCAGLREITRNFHCRRGEIDLIMLDKKVVVFVEVRARLNCSVLHPLESIDRNKVNKIILTSKYFIQSNRKYQSSNCRYDVVCLTGPVDSANIEWIKNAFDA